MSLSVDLSADTPSRDKRTHGLWAPSRGVFHIDNNLGDCSHRKGEENMAVASRLESFTPNETIRRDKVEMCF